jgi:hypothetical protein
METTHLAQENIFPSVSPRHEFPTSINGVSRDADSKIPHHSLYVKDVIAVEPLIALVTTTTTILVLLLLASHPTKKKMMMKFSYCCGPQ